MLVSEMLNTGGDGRRTDTDQRRCRDPRERRTEQWLLSIALLCAEVVAEVAGLQLQVGADDGAVEGHVAGSLKVMIIIII